MGSVRLVAIDDKPALTRTIRQDKLAVSGGFINITSLGKMEYFELSHLFLQAPRGHGYSNLALLSSLPLKVSLLSSLS